MALLYLVLLFCPFFLSFFLLTTPVQQGQPRTRCAPASATTFALHCIPLIVNLDQVAYRYRYHRIQGKTGGFTKTFILVRLFVEFLALSSYSGGKLRSGEVHVSQTRPCQYFWFKYALCFASQQNLQVKLLQLIFAFNLNMKCEVHSIHFISDLEVN